MLKSWLREGWEWNSVCCKWCRECIKQYDQCHSNGLWSINFQSPNHNCNEKSFYLHEHQNVNFVFQFYSKIYLFSWPITCRIGLYLTIFTQNFTENRFQRQKIGLDWFSLHDLADFHCFLGMDLKEYAWNNLSAVHWNNVDMGEKTENSLGMKCYLCLCIIFCSIEKILYFNSYWEMNNNNKELI